MELSSTRILALLSKLYKEWNISNPNNLKMFTGYEDIDLAQFTKSRYEKDKEQLIDDVFNVYRSVGIIPITYFSEDGVIDAINSLSKYTTNPIQNDVLGLGNTEYKIEERWIKLTETLGFEYKNSIKMLLNSRPGVGNEGRQKFENIYTFTKKANKC